MLPPLLDAQQLRDHLTPLLAETPGGALLFDADGTLWSHDVGHAVFEFACQASLLRDEAHQGLWQELERLNHDVDSAHTPSQLGSLLLDAYVQQKYEERAAAEMMVWAYAGFAELELRELIREALHHAGHTAGIHERVFDVAVWAREQGALTYVVSASPRLVVEEATMVLGFETSQVTGGVARRSAELLALGMAEPLPYGPGKVQAGLQLTGERPWLAAFGDSGFDLDMLGRAQVAIGIGEKSALIAGISRFPGAVRLIPD